MSTYYTDYPTRRLSRSNPYRACVFCLRTDPDINGRLERHNADCLYRRAREAILAGGSTQIIAELEDMHEDVDRYFYETRPLLDELRETQAASLSAR